MQALVTVIIPASRVSTLGECLRAVRANSIPVKILVIRTVEANEINKIAQQYNADICDFISNTAQHQAREYGLNLVETPYVHFLDDDDFIGPAFYEKAVKTLKEADAAMTTPGIGVGLRVTTFSYKRSRVATNCSAIVYKTDSIRRVFEQLPKDLNSCYEDYLYNLTLVLRNGGIIRPFSGGLARGHYHTERKIWDTHFTEEAYRFWYDLLREEIPLQGSSFVDAYFTVHFKEARKWFRLCAIYSFPVSTDLLEHRGLFGYRTFSG